MSHWSISYQTGIQIIKILNDVLLNPLEFMLWAKEICSVVTFDFFLNKLSLEF